MPWPWLAAFGTWIGWAAGSVLRLRRAHVEEAMRQAGIADAAREARAMYRALGRSAAEFLWLAARGSEALDHAALDATSQSLWDRAVARGHGVVIAASHTGNWDLAACAMAKRAPLLVITKRLRQTALDVFWQTTRAGQGVHLADARGALGRARDVLRRGGAVAMMIDQVPGTARHAIALNFLGRTAFADRAPAVLAARAGAPFVVAASRRDDRGEHVLQVLEVLIPPARAGRAWVDEATRCAAQALDGFRPRLSEPMAVAAPALEVAARARHGEGRPRPARG